MANPIKTGLKFYVNAGSTTIVSHKQLSDSQTAGVVIFDEPSKQLWVNGIAYGLSNTQGLQFDQIVTALKANHILESTVTNGVYESNGDQFGTLTRSLAGVSDSTANNSATVSELITLLQTEISTLTQGSVTSVNNQPVDSGTTNVTITGEHVDVGGSGTHYASSTVSAAIQDLYNSFSSIDKDSFVNEGTLVYFTADSYGEPAVAVEGRHTTDYTLNTEYSTSNTGSFTKPYIKLVIVQSTGTSNGQTSGTSTEAYIYIKATSLVDVYTATNQTGAVSVNIDSNRNITASLVNAASHTKQNTALDAPSGTITSASTTSVYSQVSVTTQDGQVSEVSGSTKLVDAAGAAAAAEAAAKDYADSLATNYDAAGAATTAANSVISWEVLSAS